MPKVTQIINDKEESRYLKPWLSISKAITISGVPQGRLWKSIYFWSLNRDLLHKIIQLFAGATEATFQNM